MHKDRALWFALGGLAVACAAFALYQLGPHDRRWLPGCTFHQLTGLNCPGCGMTRASCLLAHGDILASLRMHPLALPFALELLLSGRLLPVALMPGWVQDVADYVGDSLGLSREAAKTDASTKMLIL